MNISEIFRFVFSGIVKCFKILDDFIIEERIGISFLDLMVYLIFANIVIFIIAFMKQYAEVKQVNENKKDEMKKARRG